MDYEKKDVLLYLDKVELGYGYGNDYNCVLKNLNLIEKDVYRKNHVTGQTIAVVGRSGRGKSTLFKALSGLILPKSGQILLNNYKTEEKNDAKQVEEGDMGFVDQKYTLFRHKTITQTLIYALRKSSLTKKEKREKTLNVLLNWGLEPHKDKYPCELSGGQRQRTAILEKMFSSSHFIIFDEPTSGLDVVNIETIKQYFRMIHKEDELNTIIFSSHDLEFAVEMADVIYVIGKENQYDTYSTFVNKIDLRDRGIAWQKTFTKSHVDILEEVKTTMRNS